MNIHVLQHVPFEGPAGIEEWALSKGHAVTTTRFYAQEQFPPLERFDLLVVMGGPMSIHDEHLYHWLKGEKWFVKQAIEAGKPVLGVCLGAQLIAAVLGAKVIPGEQKEIGWWAISMDAGFLSTSLGRELPAEPTVFHWHGETFTLPEGAQRIASSVVCENQGFIYDDNVIALQFHLESTPASVDSILEYCADELVEGDYIQSAEMIASEIGYLAEMKTSLEVFMDYLEKQAHNQ